MTWPRSLLDREHLYSLTASYVGAAACLMAVSEGLVSLGLALILEGILVLCLMVLSVLRETRQIAVTTDSRLAALNEHIEDLTLALHAAGVPIPARRIKP